MTSCKDLHRRVARCARILSEARSAQPPKAAADVLDALQDRLGGAQLFLNRPDADSPQEAIRRDVLDKLCELIETEFPERDLAMSCKATKG